MEDIVTKPAFGKFRTLLKQHGIGTTAGYDLVRAGLIKTFHIGIATYAEIREFDELPTKLQDPEAQARLAVVKGNVIKAAA